MGPSCRKRSKSTRKFKSSCQKTDQVEKSDNPDSSIVFPSTDAEVGCSTPKGERFRIPEIKTCPRAPKRRRMISSCSLRRTSIALLVPLDIDPFFNLGCCGIPV